MVPSNSTLLAMLGGAIELLKSRKGYATISSRSFPFDLITFRSDTGVLCVIMLHVYH